MHDCLIVFVLLALVHTGTTLRCWTCQSDTNPDCDDPFEADGRMPTPCIPDITDRNRIDDIAPICTKARIKVNEQESYVTRMCEWVSPSHPSFCQFDQLPSHSKVEYCSQCRGDGCNGSSRVGAGVAWIVALMTLLQTCLINL